MFTMVFVNNFWNIHDVPRWLEHAPEGVDFMGLADVVFPCFLFVVGMSIPYALEARRARGYTGESTIGHILARTLALILMGVFIVNSEARLSPDAYPVWVYRIAMVAAFIMVWNSYPPADSRVRRHTYTVLRLVGVLILAVLALTFRDPEGGVFSARWWGILGIIGWSYLVCAMVYVFGRGRLSWLAGSLAVFVALCMLLTPVREGLGGGALLSLPHPNFLSDMLGVLQVGNGSSVAMVMAGVVFSTLCVRAANWPARRKALATLGTVAVLTAAGFATRSVWIVSKLSGTPPWILLVMAISIGMYAILSWLASRGWDGWLRVISPAGTATLTCYIVPYLAYSLADMTGITAPGWFTHGVAGIVNCLLFSLAVIGVTWALGRIKIKLKI